jgi:hypothetical protein
LLYWYTRDANATLDSDSKPFAQMLSEYDPHNLYSSTPPAPSTYMGAPNRRINFIFDCQHVVQCLTQQGTTLSYYEGLQADHRGLLIDLDVNKLLNITLQPAQQPFSSRILKSGIPELVKMYTESVHLSPSVLRGTQDDYSRLESIQGVNQAKHSRGTLRHLLETWDKYQGIATMLHAESTFRKPPQSYQWSAVLRNCSIL